MLNSEIPSNTVLNTVPLTRLFLTAWQLLISCLRVEIPT